VKKETNVIVLQQLVKAELDLQHCSINDQQLWNCCWNDKLVSRGIAHQLCCCLFWIPTLGRILPQLCHLVLQLFCRAYGVHTAKATGTVYCYPLLFSL